MTQPTENFDQALAHRLSRLSTMPVDTSNLERAVREQVGRPANPYARLLRPFAAVAATLIFLAIIAFAMLQNRPAQASADLMLQLHRDIVAGAIPSMKVDSIEDVNEAFAAFGQQGLKMTAPPEMQVMSCCMHDVANRKVACILVKDAGVPITLSVADTDALKPLASAPVMHNGEAFHVQAGGELNMVMVDRGTHRICLIGALPAEKLMGLTDKLKF